LGAVSITRVFRVQGKVKTDKSAFGDLYKCFGLLVGKVRFDSED